MMALEGQETPDPFFDSGLQMLVDGADESKLTVQLKKELKAMQGRHEKNIGCAQSWVDIAPAMGMIGTLVGLVAMLGYMAERVSSASEVDDYVIATSVEVSDDPIEEFCIVNLPTFKFFKTMPSSYAFKFLMCNLPICALAPAVSITIRS